jgi:hypothetical protein
MAIGTGTRFATACLLVQVCTGVPGHAQTRQPAQIPTAGQMPTVGQIPTVGQMPTVGQIKAGAQTTVSTPQSIDADCEEAGRLAERTHALPAGLLLAIGRIESGRWDAARGRVVPWPWAIDVGGDGRVFDNKATAITQTAVLRGGGTRNIDVGCFQINLASHPAAFTDLAQAFDPIANADYAGRFLNELYVRLGNWDSAVAAYHSMEPERGAHYRELVFANWSLRDRSDTTEMLRDRRLGTDAANKPLVVVFASGARMTIWTSAMPSGLVDAPAGSIGHAAPLPHVIVGRPPLPHAPDLPRVTNMPRVTELARVSELAHVTAGTSGQ